MSTGPGLFCSVTTSSSELPLNDLLAELSRCSCRFVDIYLMRHIEIVEYLRSSKPIADRDRFRKDTAAQHLADAEFSKAWFSQIGSWCAGSGVSVAAIASYLPGIAAGGSGASDIAKQQGEKAQRALVNIVAEGMRTIGSLFAGRAFIVEIVGGSLIDPVNNAGLVRKSPRETKLEQLANSLVNVVDAVRRSTEDRNWCLSIEIEPGENYCCDSVDSYLHLKKLFKDVVRNRGLPPDYSRHIGLNVDIGHLLVLGIEKMAAIEDVLSDIACQEITHCHASDHPAGIHARDRPLGIWHSVDRHDPLLRDIFRRLANCKNDRSAASPPFSGSIALELEGCNRFDWIARGLRNMQYLVDVSR